MRQIIKGSQRHRFGRKAESLPKDQLLLALEEAEQVEAESLAGDEAADPVRQHARAARRRANRATHLPRIEEVVDVEDKTGPCCRGLLHRTGEASSPKRSATPSRAGRA